MTWQILEKQAPGLAVLGFDRLNRAIAYLATIKKDGSPRLHPVTPFIGDGMLFIFTEPSSPKISDLNRDPRYALHCSVGAVGEPLIEFLVTGEAVQITDPQLRERAVHIAASPVVVEAYALFEFHLVSALAIRYDEDGVRTLERWRKT